MKDVLKIVFVIIGTLIGAGFASGQEMYIFFFSHGIKGIVGIIISSVLMGIIIYKTLNLLDIYNIKTYKDFLEIVLSKNSSSKFVIKKINSKNNKIKESVKYKNNKHLRIIHKDFSIKRIINCVINIFILVTFFIMIAGFGAYFEQEFGINSLFGSGILAILSFIIFLTNVKGVVKANELLIPVLVLFIVLIGSINIFNIITSNGTLEIQKYLSNQKGIKYILDAVLYCSYNSILLIPVLITLKDFLKNKKQITLISIISTIIIILLSVIIFLLLVRIDVDISKIEMPAVYVVSNMGKTLKLIYAFIILGSIFTTSISLGTSFLKNTIKNEKSYTQIAAIMCITSVIVSKIGFSNLINLLYPIFGYLGLVQTWKILKQ